MRVEYRTRSLVLGAHLRLVAGSRVMLVKSMLYAILGTVLGPAFGIGLFLLMHGAY